MSPAPKRRRARVAKAAPARSGRPAQPAVPTAPAAAPAAPAAPPAPARAAVPSFLTRPLGLEGWTALEPVVLAALASAEPLLLVGRHGTAKSFLLERLAQALELEYRFYNASLVNFDDLVGVPVPDESGTQLRYIATPTAIWDAQVVFVDELSRCRPDLANKLFPIVHERRVQGVLLEKLRYRWAAMNPPPCEDGHGAPGPGDETYLGAEPLDPALADRFAFLVEVPSWEALTDAERRAVLLDQFRGRHEFPLELPVLVANAERILAALVAAVPSRLGEYFLSLAAQRVAAGRPAFSTRRLTMLLRSALALQAARIALAHAADAGARAEQVDWNTSLWLALRHGDPELARGAKSDPAGLLALHRQAWQLSGLDLNDPWRELLTVPDPLERALRALDLPGFGPDELTPLVLDAVTAIPGQALRTAAALAFYLATHRTGRLHATAFELLARDARRALQPAQRTLSVNTIGPAREVGRLVNELPVDAATVADALRARNLHARNLLESLLPDGYGLATPQQVRDAFVGYWERLRLGTLLAPPDAAGSAT